MKHYPKYCLLFTLFFYASASYCQLSNKDVKAKILVEQVEGNVKITGTAENLTDIIQSLNYKLSVIKKNKNTNNQSNNAQEGLFTLEPSEKQNLSTTQVNVGKDDQVIILLLFYNEAKQLVGKDRVVVGEDGDEKKKVAQETVPIDGIELVGIVTNDTKTKVGKDFYDLYYYEYRDKNINAKKIITVSEELSFARNTKIIISIDNVSIYEFLARPDEEFLYLVAQESVNATYAHLVNLERQSKYITQY